MEWLKVESVNEPYGRTLQIFHIHVHGIVLFVLFHMQTTYGFLYYRIDGWHVV